MKVLPKGRYIKHAQYGFGVITEADAERTAIDFDIHGLKKFVTSLMVVELVDDAPPPTARSKRRRKVTAAAAVAAGSHR
jgi:hypothetical protein